MAGGFEQFFGQTTPSAPLNEGPGFDSFFQNVNPNGRPTAYGPNKPYKPEPVVKTPAFSQARVKPIAQSDEWACGQSSVAMCVNSLTGSNYKDTDLFASGDYSLMNTLQSKTAAKGYKWQDKNFDPSMWGDIDRRVNQQGIPVVIGLGGEFSPSGRGHIITITGTKGDQVSYADPATGTIKTTTRQRIEQAPPHPKEGKFVFLGDGPRNGKLVDDTVYTGGGIAKNRGSHKINPTGLPSLADTVARAQGIDPEIYTRLISTESAFNSKAVSPVGARGLAQFMPETLKETAAKHGYTPEDYDRSESVQLRLGALHLRDLLTESPVVGGSYARALAAYNWGQGNLDTFLRGGLKLNSETRNYVSKILKVDPSEVEGLLRDGGGPQYSKMADSVRMQRDSEEFKDYFTNEFAAQWAGQIGKDGAGDAVEGAKRYLAGLTFGISELIPGMQQTDRWKNLYNDDLLKNFQQGDVGGFAQNAMLEMPRFLGMLVMGELFAAKLGASGTLFGTEKMVNPIAIPGVKLFQDWSMRSLAKGTALGNSPIGALARLGLGGSAGVGGLDTTFAYAGAFGVQGMMESFSTSLLNGVPANEIVPKALFDGWLGALTGGAFGFGVPFVSGVGSVVLSGAGKAVPEIAGHLAQAPPWMRGLAGMAVGATAAQNIAPALGLSQEQDSWATNVGFSLGAGVAAIKAPGIMKGVLPVVETLVPKGFRDGLYGAFKGFWAKVDEKTQNILTGAMWDQLGAGGAAYKQAMRAQAFDTQRSFVSTQLSQITELEVKTTQHIQALNAKHQELTAQLDQADAMLASAPAGVQMLERRTAQAEETIARAQQIKNSTQDIKIIGQANKMETQALKDLSDMKQDPHYPYLEQIKTAQQQAQRNMDSFINESEFSQMDSFKEAQLAFSMKKDMYSQLDEFWSKPEIENHAKSIGLDEAITRGLIDPADIPKLEAPWNAPNWERGLPSEESQAMFKAMGENMHRWITSRNYIPSWGRQLDDAVTAQIRSLGVSTDSLTKAKGAVNDLYERYIQNPQAITPFDAQIKSATSRKGIYTKNDPGSPYQWKGNNDPRYTTRWADPKTLLQWSRNEGLDNRFWVQGQKAGAFEEARYKVDQAIEEGKKLKPIHVTLRHNADGSVAPLIDPKDLATMDALVNRGASHVPLKFASSQDEKLFKRALVGERAKQNKQLRADILEGARKDLAPLLGASMKEMEQMSPQELRQKVIEIHQAQNRVPDFEQAEIEFMQMSPAQRESLLYDEASRMARAFDDYELIDQVERQKILKGLNVEQSPENQQFLKDFEEFMGITDPGVTQAFFNEINHARSNGLTGTWEDVFGKTKDGFMGMVTNRKAAVFKLTRDIETRFNESWKDVMKEVPIETKVSTVKEAFTQALESPAKMKAVLTEHPYLAPSLDFYLKLHRIAERFGAIAPELGPVRAYNELMYRHPHLEQWVRGQKFEEERTYKLVQELSDRFYSSQDAASFSKRRVVTDLKDPSKFEIREQIKSAEAALGKTTPKDFLEMTLDQRIKVLKDVTGGMSPSQARAYAEEKTAYLLMKHSTTDPAKLIAGKLYSIFQADSSQNLLKWMSDVQMIPREGADPLSLVIRKTGEMDSVVTNARFDGKYVNHAQKQVGYKNLSTLPGWEQTAIRNADGTLVPANELLVHPDAAKFLEDFGATRDAIDHGNWMDSFASFVRQTTLFGTPVPHVFNIMTARMSDFVTAPLKAVGLLKAGQKMFESGLKVEGERMSPRALELVATRYGLNLRSQDATLKLITEDVISTLPEDMAASLWAKNQSTTTKLFTAMDPTNPRSDESLKQLGSLARIPATIFQTLGRVDYTMNRHMLFEPIRMSQLAGFYYTVAENMQRFSKEFAGLPKDVAFRHAATAAATKMNVVHGALPHIWWSDEARKNAYKYLMTPNWAMSKVQMIMSAMEPWLGLTGKKAVGFKGVGAFSHLPQEMRQELGVQFTKMLVAGTFGFIGATQMASYLINGRSTFEQPPDKIFHLQVGGHYYNSPLFGFYRDLAKAFGGSAAQRSIEPIIEGFVNQVSPAYKTAIQGMLTKKDDLGRPIYRPEGGGQLMDVMGFIGQNLVNTEDTFGVKPGSNPLQVFGVAADGRRSIQRLNGREWLLRQFGVYESDWRVPTQMRADLQSRKMFWQQNLSNKVTELVRAAQETDNSELAQRYLQDAFMTGLQGIPVDDHYLKPHLPDGRMMMTPEGLKNVIIKAYAPEAAALDGAFSQPEIVLPLLERIAKEQELQELGRNRAFLSPGR